MYAQYLNADIHKKDEYLLQARFVTRVLQKKIYSETELSGNRMQLKYRY